MKKLIFVVLLYFSSTYSAWAAGHIGVGQVQNMQSAYGGWLLFMSGTNANPDSCPVNIAILDPSFVPQQYKEYVALFMSAQIAKTPINIFVAGCHGAGYKLLYFVVTG